MGARPPPGPAQRQGIRLGQSGLCPSDPEGVEPAVVAVDAAQAQLNQAARCHLAACQQLGLPATPA